MNKKVTIVIVVAVILFSLFLVFEVSQGDLKEMLFDEITYNYSSHVWIPPNSPDEGSLGGYYKIHGKGRNFNFFLVLPGAEKLEHPICYTGEGLSGSGKIKNIDITFDTLKSLYYGDLKQAMFETRFSGDFNMTCASWKGFGNFSNDGDLTGAFQIIGAATYWEGTFKMVEEGNRIAVISDYIYYPNNHPEKVKRVKKTYYM